MIPARYREFARFLVVGVFNTFVGLGVIYACKWFFHLGDALANAVGYAVGVLVSFTLNSKWTFGFSGDRLPALLRFIAVALIAYAMNLLTVMLLIHLGVNSYVAQALGIPPYTLTSYFLSKYFVFDTGRKPAAPAKTGDS
jgi:putative flippase GtrA